MKRILKYQLDITDTQQIRTHKGFIPLWVQFRAGVLCLWMLIDDVAPVCRADVYIYGTGHLVENESDTLAYVGTAQEPASAFSSLVWHVFIDLEDDR